MNILVVGAGEMGRWAAETLRCHAGATVAFTDTDPSAAADAADAVGGRAVSTDTDERFDVVCVAVPMPVAGDVIADYAPLATGALVDVTGSMDGPVRAMREAAPERGRLSLHPLFAAENAPGNVAAVTDAASETTDAVLAALEASDNRTFETTPGEHDRAMETVQAGAHTAILAFALAAADVPETFQTPVSAELFDLVDQVAGGDAQVYADIQRAFDGADDVAAAARELADADPEEFARIYECLSTDT